MSFATYPSLAGRGVLVTGGASGIGADIVRAFAGQGARVAFLDVQAGPGGALADALAGAAHPPAFLACDITDTAALRAAVAAARARVGPIGVLVNNAGDDARHPIAPYEPEAWDAAQAVNLRPMFFAAQAVRADMTARGGGSIVNLSSVLWRIGGPEAAAYATAKAGVVGLTRALARAFGPDGVRVNAIEPGAVMTEKQRRLWYPTEASVAAMVARQAIPRVLEGPEIARMALFLAADDSRMLTGQSIAVDAGLA